MTGTVNQEIAEKILGVPYDGENYCNDLVGMSILEHLKIGYGISKDSDTQEYSVILSGVGGGIHMTKHKSKGMAICLALLERYRGERG